MLSQVARGRRTYITPLGDTADSQMDDFFSNLTKGGKTKSLSLALRGRTVKVKEDLYLSLSICTYICVCIYIYIIHIYTHMIVYT